MENPVNSEIKIFGPRKGCPFYQSTDNKIIKDGVYSTASDPQDRQMFYTITTIYSFIAV